MEPDVVESEIPLPNELLSKIIFKFVPLCQWSNNLESVSKQFRNCVLIAYGSVKSINFRSLFSLKLSIENLNNEPRLFWSEQEAMSAARLNKILTKLLSVCRNLTEMSGFEHFSQTIDVETWKILNNFDHLESICLIDDRSKSVALKDFANFVASCKSLKNLHVNNWYFDINGTLDVSSLTHIFVYNYHGGIFLENLSEKLTSLEIQSFVTAFKSKHDAEKAVQSCTNLESLSVYINSYDDYGMLQYALPFLCKLTTLYLSGGKHTRYGLDGFYENLCIPFDSVKKQLKFVEFCRMDLCEELQKFFFTKCLHLESLKLDQFVKLSENVLKNLPKLPSNLKELHFFDRNKRILPLLLPHLVQLPNFTDLTVSGESLSEELENICYLNNLKRLKLDGRGINDSMLEKWDMKNDKMFEKLVMLEICDCKEVTDKGGCILAKKAINLQILNLTYARISDKTISVLGDVAKKLSIATLRQEKPFLFDENAILDLIKKSICLKKLDIEYELAISVTQSEAFLPFTEHVEI